MNSASHTIDPRNGNADEAHRFDIESLRSLNAWRSGDVFHTIQVGLKFCTLRNAQYVKSRQQLLEEASYSATSVPAFSNIMSIDSISDLYKTAPGSVLRFTNHTCFSVSFFDSEQFSPIIFRLGLWN